MTSMLDEKDQKLGAMLEDQKTVIANLAYKHEEVKKLQISVEELEAAKVAEELNKIQFPNDGQLNHNQDQNQGCNTST
jgi:DNA/RNA endonuclease G (NUC1)